MTQGVLRTSKDGVTMIQLSREAEHNRLDPADIAQPRSHFAEIAEDGSLALILTGSGSNAPEVRWRYSNLINLRLEKLAFDLLRKGWSDARIEKLLGDNFLRLYREAWS
jgi:hypothetical protein